MAGTRRLGGQARAGRWLAIAIALAGLTVAAGWMAAGAAPAPARANGSDQVHVATTGWKSERLETIPIARKGRGKQRVVMSLGPKRIGRMRSSARVEGMAELEISTTCLERMPKCVGRIYHFTPYIQARLVLARGPKAVRGNHVTPVTRWRSMRCSQQQPHRNHHCVFVIPPTDRAIDDASRLPCDDGACHLNMVMSAHHPSARQGHKLVIGVDDNHGITQSKGHLSAAVYRPGSARARGTRVVRQSPRLRRLSIGPPRNGAADKRVIFSRRIDNLRAGERLVVDARAVGSIKPLRYATLVQSQLVLSRKPSSTKRAGPPKRIGSFQAQFGMQNGFNCTRGSSAHSHPCVIRKVGTMRIIRDARARPLKDEGQRIPLYINLVVGTRAVGVHSHRHRGGDRMRIRGGRIAVRRYGP